MTHLFRRLGFFIAAWGLLLASSAAFAGSPSVLTFTKVFGASSIEINGSTSLTFNLSLDNVGGGGSTGAIGFTDSLPAGLVVATPSGASAVTCSGGSTPGTVTATAGAGSITLLGTNILMSGNCSFSVNVTGTTLGVKNNSVTTSAAYVVGATVTATASLTVGAAAPPAPTQPIPNSAPARPAAGVGMQPTTVDLSMNVGMRQCMLSAVQSMAGFGGATYLGQDPYGVASIDLKDGRYLSFYPFAANTDSSRAPGLYLGGTNQAVLATSCGSFDIAPAVYNLGQLGAVLVSQFGGSSANISRDGAMTSVQGDNVYVVRPDFFVSRNQTASAGLVANGSTFTFNDGLGNAQVLRSAFVDPAGLRAAIAATLPGALTILTDGTASFVPNIGGGVLLTADMVLTPAPASMAGQLLLYVGKQGNSEIYLYRGNTLLMPQRVFVTPQ